MNNLSESEFYHDSDDENAQKTSSLTNLNLPIFKSRSEIIKAVALNQFVIIHGETGCGKTTQVPQFLYQEKLNGDLMIGITQPRRIAAQSIAKRVAKEMNCPIGKTVGYEVRFNKKCDGSTTKIKFMTDGILFHECTTDRNLKEYKIIIVDEAHERNATTDVLMGLLKRIASRREDLKVIISSATINVDKFVAYFENAKVVTVFSRLYEVDIKYESYYSDYIKKTVELCSRIHQHEMKLQDEGSHVKGDILVFLTGYDEIYDCCDRLKNIMDIVPKPLCGAMDFDSQKNAFDPVRPFETKVVVATNIAETSVTIEGIKYVIDCGYVKQNRYNPRRGMEILEDVRISKSQAEQRSGRAGRTQPGVCHRLYDREVYERFAEEAVPEIFRKNLSEIYLNLAALEIDPKEFNFLDKPSPEELVRSETELIGLNLLEKNGSLTIMGFRIAQLPLSPVLGKVLMTSLQHKCTMDVIKIVAMLSEKMQNIFRRFRGYSQEADAKKSQFHDGNGDHFALLKLYNKWFEQKNNRRKWCYNNFVSADAMENVAKVIKQIRFILTRHGNVIDDRETEISTNDIKKCFVAGYFKNICICQDFKSTYYRSIDEEVFLIHGSSCLKQTRHRIILFHEAIKSTKSFASGVMQLDENFLREHFKKELALINFPDNVKKQLSF